MKMGRILLYYSLAITVLLLAVFLAFIGTIAAPDTNSQPSKSKYLFIMNEEGFSSFMMGIQPPFDQANASVVTQSSLERYYVGALLKRMPLLAACLVVLLVTGTVILSRILKKQHERQALRLAKQLRELDNGDAPTAQHPAIAEANREIRERFEAYALDYVRLSAYVTHEQKNMLSLLRAKLQLSGDAALTEEVDKVTDSLDDILTLSASKNRDNLELVDAALVCANVCDEYRKLYPAIAFEFDDDANNAIRARELWIGRAVSNLVGNAIKYGGGAIRIEVSNRKGSVIIAVSDEGEGIGEAEQDKLFDYQYRVGKLKRDGYGIGLSLVRHVCELCGGLIWAENRPERGATFYMVLPEADADAEAEAEVEP